jgi:glycosyltransferase involved in cell wall biosynthesis
MVNDKKIIYIFALAAQGSGISGSDRIFIEFAKRWAKKSSVKIYVDSEGREMCKRQNLQDRNIKYTIANIPQLGFFLNYIQRIIAGIRLGLTLRLENSSNTIIYSASEFWMDSLPCFILKLRFSKVRWAASWYMTAPNPLVGFREGNRENKYRVSAFFYWLVQLPIKPIIARFADFVLINNEDERKQFPRHNRLGKAIVVIGAVNLTETEKYKKKFLKLPQVYDAVFQGRFHPQKGVVELIDIWKKVTVQKPNAKLVMIGDGPLMSEVKKKVKNLNLEKNIELLGYVFDGNKKYRTFAQSKVVVHPAFYDSGGMAAAEAMAFGLPCVGFNLLSYQSYYPYGMIKVKIGDLNAFAREILRLLNDKNVREKKGEEALEMIKKSWSWDVRAKEVLEKITA